MPPTNSANQARRRQSYASRRGRVIRKVTDDLYEVDREGGSRMSCVMCFYKPAHELHVSARAEVAQPIFARAVMIERTIGHTLKAGQSLESMITEWSRGESHEEIDESPADVACSTSISRQPESISQLEHNQA